MNNQLNILINAYEDEAIELQKQLDYCISNEAFDYLGAYHYKNALQYTKEQLFRLKRFDDPLYDKKMRQTMLIKGHERRLANESDIHMKVYFEEVLQRDKQKLEELEQIPKPENDPATEMLLTSTLLRLTKREIKNVKLVLRKYENLLLQFSYKVKKLTITLPHLKKHRKNYTLGSYEIDFLQTIGFQMDLDENKPVISIFGKSEELLEQLNMLMLKIVFGVFRYKGFRDDSYLQFDEKGKGRRN